MKQYKAASTPGKKPGCTCFIVPAYMLEKQILEGNQEQKKAAVYNMKLSGNELELPGNPVRYEGGKDTGDSSADEVYKNTGLTWDFYNAEFGRNSINDQGMTLVSSVNFGDKWDNAMWNGTQMVYG